MVKRLLNQIVPIRLITVLSGISALLCLVACSADDLNGKNGGKSGQGFVSLDLRPDTAYVMTKASSGSENADNYKIRIYKGEEEVTSFRFGDKPEKLALDAGEYVAQATWGTLVPAGFDSLYMEGSTKFSIKKDLTTQIKIAATPANAKVLVKYADSLKLAYNDYSISMSTSHTGNSPLLYKKEETRPAYFLANQSGENLNLDMLFKTASKDYNYKQSVKISPRDYVTLNVKLGQSSEDTTPAPTIRTSISNYEFPADDVAYKDIAVTTNCRDWTVTKSADWLLVEKGATKVSVTARPNTTDKIRVASLTFTAISGNKTAVAVVTILQNTKTGGGSVEPYIIPIPKRMTAEKFDDLKIDIRTNNNSWKFTQNEDSKTWLTVKQGTGEDANSLFATTTNMNNGTETRTAKIVLEASLNNVIARDTVYLTQDMELVIPEIQVQIDEVAIKDIDFLPAGESKKVQVVSNVKNWTVTFPEADESWLTIGKNENELTFTTISNTTGKSRSTIATLTAFSGNMTATYPLIITQNIGSPKITLEVIINKEITETFILEGYDLDKPVAVPVSITPVGFQNDGTISIQNGNAHSVFVNLKVVKGVEKCTLAVGAQTYDLTATAPDGLVYSPNQAGTLVTIYLDEFLNKLPNGMNICNLSITGKENSGTASVRFFVSVQ